MEEKIFYPFYEKFAELICKGFIGKVIVSFAIGLIVLGLHYYAIGALVFYHSGWLLSVIITVASLSLFFATHVFRSLMNKLRARFDSDEIEKLNELIKKHLADKNFLLGGIIFGLINSLFGYFFGLPHIYFVNESLTIIAALYFVAGFICGVAFAGIIGVTRCLNAVVSNSGAIFDYTSHDKCGGTKFIGWSLLVFSSVTLLVGILITLYISITLWSGEKNILINIIYAGWIVFPYLASIFVLLLPAVSINSSLSQYKQDKENKLSDSIQVLFDELENEDTSVERKDELYKDYEFLKAMRKEVYDMRTWPFSMGSNSVYFLSIGSSVFTTYSSILKWFPELST